MRQALALLGARGGRRHETRQLEQRIRRAVVACQRWARGIGRSTTDVAAAIGLSDRTLRAWAVRSARRRPARRGRAPRPLTREDRQMIRGAVLLQPAAVAVSTLRRWCPSASRRALATWLRTYRAAQRQRLVRLMWTRVGRVWAMDFSDAPQPIDGVYHHLVHVRDLASRYHLAALPVRRATARVVSDLLRALCATADAPLVLKVDNGAAFVSREVASWAADAGTLLLYSPPACPRYNGSIEASIGALATRIHEAAAAGGHPESWTSEDVACARTAGNSLVYGGETALERWRAAARITAIERRHFQDRYSQTRTTIAPATTAITRAAMRAAARTAIVHTLHELGYVSMRRRAELVQ